MTIVAGPPGGGKSSHFAVPRSGVDWFNGDDRAAQLNSGSYQQIPPEIRVASGRQLQQFIESHIEARVSFAYENALRTDACFEQIRRAKSMGFQVNMDFLAAGPVEEHIRRVINRASLGGHSASERKLRYIYEHSMKNLVTAFEENRLGHIDQLQVFDNSRRFSRPRIILRMAGGLPKIMAADSPAWLESALERSTFNVASLRRAFDQRVD